MRKLKQTGDTIVEVLVALAVTSLVISAAMASARQSLLGSLQSQERSEAMKIAESQLESLRSTGFKALASPPRTNFCYNGGALASAPCSVSGAGIAYTVNITRTTVLDHIFTIRVVWNRATGLGQDEVTMKYAVY